MRRLIILSILAGLLIVGYIGAESLPPVSTNNANSNKAKKQVNDSQANKTQPSEPTSTSGTGLVSSVNSKYMPCEAATSSGDDKTKNNDANYFWRWPPSSGWAVAYITFAYAFIALVQLGAIFCQAKIARQALTTSERAWVGVGFERSYILGNDFVDLRIFNSGKSVGHIKDVQLFGFEAVDKGKPLPDKPKCVQPPGMGTWTTFPGESTIQRWDVRLDQKSITDVAAKTKLLPIHGFVRYADIFGNEHITKFYRVWMAVEGPLNGKFNIPPDAAPGQNEAT